MPRKAMILIVLLVAMPLCLFADNKSFKISHLVDVETVYSLKFREYTSSLDQVGEEISSVVLSDGGKHLLASLFLNFNRTIQFKNINIAFTDLVNTEDSDSYYPYQMEILVPGQSNAHLVEVYADQTGHGSGYARLLSSITTFSRTTTADSEDLRLADFAITLNEEGVQNGTYSGTLTFTFEVN